MKKLFFIAAIALFTGSCKKEYICSCKTTNDTGTITTKEFVIKLVKRKDAESECKNKEISVPMENMECTLK